MVLQLPPVNALNAYATASIEDGDAALARRIASGEVRALDAVYDRYSRPVWSFALKMTGDREVAEDVVQEVFVRLWRRAASFDPERGKLLSWLLTITHHAAIDELRRRRAQQSRETGRESFSSAAESVSDPTDSYAHVEDREAVQHALRRLPDTQRVPLQMAFYGGLTQVEIADALATPLGTIKTRMRLGLLKLRPLLADFAGRNRTPAALAA
jgi:RNA polymerase sigma-70 factor (ECF subfamily)